jgi:2-heptyl-3-hydroxy-4(1H)-quinolone synthase
MAMISTLVIGGGIGGLSLARELSLRHLPVTVLERAPQLNPVGAGIIMNPNAMGVLERNRLADAVREQSWPYLTRETCDARGRVLAIRDYRPLYDAGKLARGALVHRAHLLDVLYRALPWGAVRFGVTVTAIERLADRVRVTTEGGDVMDADIVVGADGIRSQVRRETFGDVAPIYMGYRSHRLIVDNVANVRQFTDLMGRGQRIGLVPISQERLYVWTTFNSPYDQASVLRSADDFRALFAQFTDDRVRRIFSQVRTVDEIIVTEIDELRLDRWIGDRVALLGDAAHAMTPNIGQGAGMAMEDAAVLAAELAAADQSLQGLARALENYMRRRQPRVASVMRISREVGNEGQLSRPLACWLRNRRIQRAGRNVEKSLADLERLLAYPV